MISTLLILTLVSAESSARFEGCVLSAGRPVPGARVTLHRATLDQPLFMVYGFRLRFGPDALASERSDDEGRFGLSVDDPGSYYLRVEAPEYPPTDVGPIEVEAGSSPIRRDLHLVPGGVVVGRAIDTSGRGVKELVGLSWGDGSPRLQWSEDDGSFRFESVPPGPCVVRSIEERYGRSTIAPHVAVPPTPLFEWNLFVRSLETHCLEIPAKSPFEGSIRFGELNVMESWLIIYSVDFVGEPILVRGGDPSFKARMVPNRQYRLSGSLTLPRETRVSILDTVECHPFTKLSWQVECALGAIRGTVEASEGAEWIGCRTTQGERLIAVFTRLDDTGAFELPAVEGPNELYVSPSPGLGQSTIIGRLEVSRHKTFVWPPPK